MVPNASTPSPGFRHQRAPKPLLRAHPLMMQSFYSAPFSPFEIWPVSSAAMTIHLSATVPPSINYIFTKHPPT
ncbi:hypothetical protein LB503_012356 [Fusarium chuoi]|nr:hypothetical protein LB503_012356 [Fusarium chuoi]